MISLLRAFNRHQPSSSIWNDPSPVRQELFGVERLEQHAQSLAASQPITSHPPRVMPLRARLKDNALTLINAYRANAAELERSGSVVPAAEWLLDNYHLVEEQIREIRDDLPPGYYRQLPKLANGPFAGYPRVFGLAWAYVAHTDSHFDPETLSRFISAYQRVQPLTIGELWAVAITLRIVLIENLRRLADQITAGREARAEADALAGALLAPSEGWPLLEEFRAGSSRPLPELFAAQLAKRLRDQDPTTTPALKWLEERLLRQHSSIEAVVHQAQLRMGASNLSVRNVINSMRLISNIDWAVLFEGVSLVDARLRAGTDFAAMDFPTRNLYRSAIEQLSRGSSESELEIADRAVGAAQAAAESADSIETARRRDPGFYLIGNGRRELEQAIAFRPPLQLSINRLAIRFGIFGYLGAILLLSGLLLAAALFVVDGPGVAAGLLLTWVVAAALPATEVATAIVNRAITWSFGAIPLPGLQLTGGVPRQFRTLVAVPILLTSARDLLHQIEQLEIHHLSSPGGDIVFAILSDGVDADAETLAGDQPWLAAGAAAIDALNRKYGPSPAGDRFLLLHRRRLFNPSEGKWMGWERKRGKLHELNRLLRGAADTTFMPIGGRPPLVPPDVRYVITLDADTRLPRDVAVKLIGKMAHPLNRPRFDPVGQRVVDGYAILQPRVTPSLPAPGEGSFYQRVTAGPGGIDPYAAAVSDVYQDLFGEGSFAGKGIYDVDAFEAALAGRIPENRLLSHDLFEGVFARAGLASDVEVIEDVPARYDVVAKRLHRWTRGDWQLLPWIFGRAKGSHALSAVGRGKMLDNLRRSLLAPATLAALIVGWLLPAGAATVGTAIVLAAVAIPAFLPILFSLLPQHSGILLRRHIAGIAVDGKLALAQSILSIAFLVDQTWRMTTAVVTTIGRLLITRRHLLEWTTAATSAARPRLDIGGFYREMTGGIALAVAIGAVVLASAPASYFLLLPFALLWAMAPILAWWVSRPLPSSSPMAEGTGEELRHVARRTWRFFENFVTPAENMLPPDNFQEEPVPVVAHRTSPTNIGLYLLATVAARDFGWAGMTETVERLEATFATLAKLAKFNGHFLNWYGTQDLRPLDPPYVSSVDSGNFAGHLIALANACEEWAEQPFDDNARAGLRDNVDLAGEALAALHAAAQNLQPLAAALAEIKSQLGTPQSFDSLLPSLRRLSEKATRATESIVPIRAGVSLSNVVFWTGALARLVAAHGHDRQHRGDAAALKARLRTIADTARQTAMAMDFAFLLDRERKLLSIGYSVNDNRLDPSCYDLLASEARLASLFAIAKGDIATKHWFRLGRTATPIGAGSALISWSGSMFEYLMPSLVMRAPAGSLLERSNRFAVQRQQSYGRSLGIPWGVSESGYNARDVEFTYQYSNFGVPGLGLKRGLSENVVIAPYATGLATMIDPDGARQNFARLASMGAAGLYGFYEALDFTRSRLPQGESVAVVRNFMAHHQGMTIVAIANTLCDGRMRTRFHREPMIQATELLLQERMPRNIAVAHPRAEEVQSSAAISAQPPAARRVAGTAGGPVATHLLSNGRYAVMLTAAGGGYSRWGDIAVTRWREDATRDNWGSFVFVRDTRSGVVWSATAQPTGGAPDREEALFAEDSAQYLRREAGFTTSMDVIVSSESDGEVRRVVLTNTGRRAREIELTSFAELALTTAAADNAHPAFAKMFIETEYLADFGALVAHRRPRSAEEPQIWAAHFAVVDGDLTAEPQYETDRAKFIGRERDAGTAVALEGAPLTNTVGTVLDPVFSLRQSLTIAPGRKARVAFWTVIASSRAKLLDLVDQHHDRSAFDRARTLAWTQAQVELRHLDIKPQEASDFQRLAGPILYADRRFRASSNAIIRGAAPQSGLWGSAISGDLPIVVLRIEDIEDMTQVIQLLRAHEYWRIKRLAVDVVIINERAASYVQDLQIAIETAVRSRSSHPGTAEPGHGRVYALRSDLMTSAGRALLLAAARVVLTASRGSITDQLQRPGPATALPAAPGERQRQSSTDRGSPTQATDTLEFFNGFGGFDEDGREYVTVLEAGRSTPAPWINVIANPAFGFQVSTAGSGYSWALNSRENQITPWSNDPVEDPIGEVFYIRDEASGEVWSPTALPIRNGGAYVTRHGFGYSVFEHVTAGIASELLQLVPLADPIKISRLRLTNLSGLSRRLSVTAYVDWALGTSRAASGPFIITEMDVESGALLARNPWSISFAGQVSFLDLAGKQDAWTADRTEFIGRNGSLAKPAALFGGNPLSGNTGAGLDPCGALQSPLELAPGETVEIVAFLGQTGSAEAARTLIQRYRQADIAALLREVKDHWAHTLGAVQVRTPNRALDIMLNGWLLYQTLACRIWARSAFYQASGAYGFRDQLQDAMALTLSQPALTRHHLLRAARRQFVEGDVQHWWLPHSGQGVRTRISDDRVWLAYATAHYIATSGDAAVLDEVFPFLEGTKLRAGEHDAFYQPTESDETASLFEHCARGLDQCLALTGPHGLPLIGTGDWNDGMNRVGEGGKGESVWLAWLLLRTIDLFSQHAEGRDLPRAERWRSHAASVRAAVERTAWDGQWYRRATFDDGTWLGSQSNDECRIDSIAQSWAVLSGAADPARAATAMQSLERHLVRQDEGLVLLFTPPFDKTSRDPGYIKGYPPGLRENGGQYSHAAMWAILALAKLGASERALQLFDIVNPINHAKTAAEAERYKVEPYVVAADVYSVPPHGGRGGWTWYTGSAGWMYRAGIEGLLGICRENGFLVVHPSLPATWPGYEATVTIDLTRYDVQVLAKGSGGEAAGAFLDGAPIESGFGRICLPLDGRGHRLVMFA